jgi:hypothetical protein
MLSFKFWQAFLIFLKGPKYEEKNHSGLSLQLPRIIQHHLYLYLFDPLKRFFLTCNYVISSINQHMSH